MNRLVRAFVVASLAFAPAAVAQPLTTRFTYQGRIDPPSPPAAGLYDLRFTLYTAPFGGSVVGGPQCADNIVAEGDGSFTVGLDFGDVFNGDERYLQIDIRRDTGQSCANAAGFEPLGNRQRLTAAPYASTALKSLKPWSPINVGGTQIQFTGTFVGINTSIPLTGNTLFQVSRVGSPSNAFGGMFVTTDVANGRPFYGYANGVSNLTYHYLDGTNQSFRLVHNSFEVAAFNSTGDLGIGIGVPLAKLHVGGVARADDFVYNAPVTRYWTVGAAGWFPQFDDVVSNGVGAAPANSGSSDYIVTPVQLPDGCTIRRITFGYLDNNAGTDMVIRFSSRGLTEIFTDHATFTTSGAVGGARTQSFNLNLVYDARRIWVVYVDPTVNWSQPMYMQYVQIEYTLDRP